MAFLKSNLPPQVGEDHVYFPTTLDQVIKPDGTRLSMDDLGGGGSAETSDTASKLEKPRKITLSGKISGSVEFDGSKDVTINTSSNLTASDVGARPNTWTPSVSDVGAVPTSRKINNKPLTGDVTLAGSDISGVVTSVNGSSGAVTVSTIKTWTGTLTWDDSAGFYILPSGITSSNFISGVVVGSYTNSIFDVSNQLVLWVYKNVWRLRPAITGNVDVLNDLGNVSARIYYI